MQQPASLQATVEASCRRLEGIASSMGVKLSLDPSGVQHLEEIVLSLRGIRADEGAMSGATFMIGTYLGEILRAKLGGDWCKSPEGELALSVGDTLYFPVAKARKFAANPDGPDSLSFFTNAALARDA